MKKREIQRTVQYWRLVNANGSSPVAEQNWGEIFKNAYGKPKTYRVLDKDITCNVVTLDIRDEWKDFVPPTGMAGVIPWSDGAIYGLTVSTDKDHVPNQGNHKSGVQQPMGLNKGFVPIDNLFVWFLPFGNMFGIMMENISAARPRLFAQWLTMLMRDQGVLPQHNLLWDAAPVVDLERKQALKKAHNLKSILVAGTVQPQQTSSLHEIFGGPEFEGTYQVQFKIKALKKGKPKAYAHDTAKMKQWFDSTFGGQFAGLSTARIQFVPGNDALPVGEIDLLQHRLTRKRSVMMRPGPAQAFVASSALAEIVNAYVVDFDELEKLRKS